MTPTRLLLFASLGINLFVAGWWLGDISRRPEHFAPKPVNFSGMLQPRLDPATLELIREPLAELDAMMASGFRARWTLFDKLREAVTKEPYDREMVNGLLDQLPDQRLANERAQWTLIGEALEKLSLDQRTAFAELIFARRLPPPIPTQGMFPQFGSQDRNFPPPPR